MFIIIIDFIMSISVGVCLYVRSANLLLNIIISIIITKMNASTLHLRIVFLTMYFVYYSILLHTI